MKKKCVLKRKLLLKSILKRKLLQKKYIKTLFEKKNNYLRKENTKEMCFSMMICLLGKFYYLNNVEEDGVKKKCFDLPETTKQVFFMSRRENARDPEASRLKIVRNDAIHVKRVYRNVKTLERVDSALRVHYATPQHVTS